MLTDLYTLPTTANYPNAAQQNDVLPVLYGDLTENSGGGVTNCPCLYVDAHIYGIAAHEILSAGAGNEFYVYENGVLTEKSYEVNPAYTGDAGDVIAIVTFLEAPDEPVSIACKGKLDADGNLITNPVDVIIDLLTDDTTFDPTTVAKARQTADDLGYTCAGAIVQDTTFAVLLTQIMSTFLGDWYINGDKALVLAFDSEETIYQVSGFLKRSRCEWQRATRRLENIANQIQVNYAVAFVTIDKRFSKGFRADNYYMTDDGDSTKDIASQNVYGTRLAPLELNWTRNTTAAQVIQARAVEKFANPIWLVDITGHSPYNMMVEKGDFVVFDCPFLRDESGEKLQAQIGRVIEIEKDLDNLTISYKLQDTGRFFPASPIQYNGDHTYGDGSYYGGQRFRDVTA